MWRLTILSAGCFFATGTAYAAPTSLKCNYYGSEYYVISFEPSSSNADVEYNLSGDEGGAGHVIGDIRFTPQIATVKFSVPRNLGKSTYILQINRENLSWTGSLTLSSSMLGPTTIPRSGGQCEVVQQKKTTNKF